MLAMLKWAWFSHIQVSKAHYEKQSKQASLCILELYQAHYSITEHKFAKIGNANLPSDSSVGASIFMLGSANFHSNRHSIRRHDIPWLHNILRNRQASEVSQRVEQDMTYLSQKRHSRPQSFAAKIYGLLQARFCVKIIICVCVIQCINCILHLHFTNSYLIKKLKLNSNLAMAKRAQKR